MAELEFGHAPASPNAQASRTRPCHTITPVFGRGQVILRDPTSGVL